MPETISPKNPWSHELERIALASGRRPMRVWLETEMRIPDGPYKGERFRVSYQPWTGLWLDAIDSGQWMVYVFTGPSQIGKSLMGYVYPALYALFELGENVVCGIPDLAMVNDKWTQDFLPAILNSSYANLIPVSGAGARGGTIKNQVKFTNGATLRFMTGGARDSGRAGFTARYLVVTEVCSMGTRSETTEEADKIEQLFARIRAWLRHGGARVFLEGTNQSTMGRIWQEYLIGTQSYVAQRCHACGGWFRPERKHFTGWQGSQSELEAIEEARLACPGCGVIWTEQDRQESLKNLRMVSQGQTITESGEIAGEPTKARAFSLHVTAACNSFVPLSALASDEWRATRSPDTEGAERKIHQIVWGYPTPCEEDSGETLQVHDITGRLGSENKGVIPDWANSVTVAADVGRHLIHWSAIAWGEQRGQVIDYGVMAVMSRHMDEGTAICSALDELHEMSALGWSDGGNQSAPNVNVVDCGYMTDTVVKWAKERGWMPIRGFGKSETGSGGYSVPPSTERVKWKSDGADCRFWKQYRTFVLSTDADYWKSRVFESLICDRSAAHALTLYSTGDANEHRSIANHFTAEREETTFEPGRGERKRWVRVKKQNHWFDTAYMNFVAAAYLKSAGSKKKETKRVTWFQ